MYVRVQAIRSSLRSYFYKKYKHFIHDVMHYESLYAKRAAKHFFDKKKKKCFHDLKPPTELNATLV